MAKFFKLASLPMLSKFSKFANLANLVKMAYFAKVAKLANLAKMAMFSKMAKLSKWTGGYKNENNFSFSLQGIENIVEAWLRL